MSTELVLFAVLVCLKLSFVLWVEIQCRAERKEYAAHKAAVNEFLLEWEPFLEESKRFGWFAKKRA